MDHFFYDKYNKSYVLKKINVGADVSERISWKNIKMQLE